MLSTPLVAALQDELTKIGWVIPAALASATAGGYLYHKGMGEFDIYKQQRQEAKQIPDHVQRAMYGAAMSRARMERARHALRNAALLGGGVALGTTYLAHPGFRGFVNKFPGSLMDAGRRVVS